MDEIKWDEEEVRTAIAVARKKEQERKVSNLAEFENDVITELYRTPMRSDVLLMYDEEGKEPNRVALSKYVDLEVCHNIRVLLLADTVMAMAGQIAHRAVTCGHRSAMDLAHDLITVYK